MIVNAAVRRREKTIMGVQPQRVPRIHDRTALDSPVQKVHDLRQLLGRKSRPTRVGQLIPLRQRAVDPAENAGRSDRHHVGFRTDYQADLRGLLEVFGRESVIRLKRGADVLFDLSRANRTSANRKRIMRAALQDGDRIKVSNIDTVLGARL